MKTKSGCPAKKIFMRLVSLLMAAVVMVTMSVPVYAEDSDFRSARVWRSDRNYLKDVKVLGFYSSKGSENEGCYILDVLDCGLDRVFDAVEQYCDEEYDHSRIAFEVKIYFDPNVAISAYCFFDKNRYGYVQPRVRYNSRSSFSYTKTDIKDVRIFQNESESTLTYFDITQENDFILSFVIPPKSRLLPYIQNALTNNVELVVYEDDDAIYYSDSVRVSPYIDELNVDIGSLEIAPIGKQNYTGSAVTPDVKITNSGYTLVKDLDYTLSYKNNKEIGTASVTITGKGKYSGSKTAKFKIVFGAPSLSVSKTKTGAKLSWKKVPGATGYQIWESVNGGKFKKVKATAYTSQSLSLNSGKTYKFKIRAYTPRGDEIVYSSFSAVKTVKK